MKICNCKCGNCENDDHGHCEYNCTRVDYCTECGEKIEEEDCAYNVCNNCRLEL